MARSSLLAVLVALGIPAASSAMDPVAPWTASASFLGGLPVGDFGDSAEFGAGLTASATRWSGTSALGLRLEFGGVVYGYDELRQRSRSSSFTTSTDNWFATMQAGPELALRTGPLRPYAFATAGASYFATSFETTTDLGTSIRSRVAYDSWTFALRVGAGLQVPVGRRTTVDLGGRYLYNPEVEYLAEGDIVLLGGAFVERPRRSSVALVEVVAGIRFDF